MRKPRRGKESTRAGRKARTRTDGVPHTMAVGQARPTRRRQVRNFDGTLTDAPVNKSQPGPKAERQRRATQTKPKQHSGSYTPAERKDKRGKVINPSGAGQVKSYALGFKIVVGWFSGNDDPPFGHRTRAAAMRRIPKAERGRGVKPRMCTFERSLYG